MNTSEQLAKHFRDLYFGGNWTAVNFKEVLSDVTWEQATTSVHNLNSIATLVFHMNYYVNPVLKVLEGEPLNASDKLSFDVPAITCREDWENLVQKALVEAETFAQKVAQLDESLFFEDFYDPKYGTYYRNLLGIIEHTYYHLGQISMLKKILVAV